MSNASFGNTEPVEIGCVALRTLRNASGLEVGQHYIITDYNRGTVGPARIHTIATSVNSISASCDVHTAFDTEAWRGWFNLDDCRLRALHDNRGNKISSDVGTEIDVFPWGNTRVTANVFDNFNFVYNNSGALVSDNHGSAFGYLSVAGADTQIRYCEINSGGDVRLSNDSRVYRSTVTTNGRLYQSGGTTERTTVSNYSYVDTGLGGTLNLNMSNFDAYSLFYGDGAVGNVHYMKMDRGYCDIRNAQSIDFDNVHLSAYGLIYGNASKRMRLLSCFATSNAYFQATGQGELVASYCSVSDNGYIRSRNGVLTSDRCTVSSAGNIDHFSTGSNIARRLEITSSGYARYLETCTGTLIDYCTIAESGRIEMRQASGAGARVHRCRVSSGYISLSGCTNTRVYYTTVDSSNSYITIQDSTSLSFYWGSMQSYGRCLIRGGRTGNIYGLDLSSTAYALITGGAGNIYYCGFSAYFYYYLTNQAAGTNKTGLHGHGRQTYTDPNPAASTTGTGERNFT